MLDRAFKTDKFFSFAKDQSDILTFIVVRPVSLLWNEPNPLEVLIPKNIGIGKT
jgi:hypothetical protein